MNNRCESVYNYIMQSILFDAFLLLARENKCPNFDYRYASTILFFSPKRFLRLDKSDGIYCVITLPDLVLRCAGGLGGKKGRPLPGNYGATGATLLPPAREKSGGNGHAKAEEGADGTQRYPEGGSQPVLRERSGRVSN